MAPKKPIRIRNQTFSSYKEAAKFYRVSKSAVSMAVARGSTHRLAMPALYKEDPNPPTPVKIRGVVYPSINSAAKALNVYRSVIVRALERGTIDNVGSRKNAPQRHEYYGVVYTSKRAAIRAMTKDLGQIYPIDIQELIKPVCDEEQE